MKVSCDTFVNILLVLVIITLVIKIVYDRFYTTEKMTEDKLPGKLSGCGVTKILVLSSNRCPYCKKWVEELNKHDIQHELKTSDHPGFSELQQIHGADVVPTTVVSVKKDGKDKTIVVKGYMEINKFLEEINC
jgi:thioredoxin-related protein